MCVSCDNLLCDALGRAPSAKLTLSYRNQRNVPYWTKMGQTEVAEVSSAIDICGLDLFSALTSDGLHIDHCVSDIFACTHHPYGLLLI